MSPLVSRCKGHVSDGNEIESHDETPRIEGVMTTRMMIRVVCSFVPHLEIVRKVSRIGLHAFHIFIPFASSDV